MSAIEQALRCTHRKKSRQKLLLILPFCYLLTCQLAFWLRPEAWALWGLLGGTVLAIPLLLRERRPELYRRLFYEPEERELFCKEADAQLGDPAAAVIQRKNRGIYLWMTPRWLIFLTPQTELICRWSQINRISKELQATRGIVRLQVEMADGRVYSFSCADLYEALDKKMKEREQQT